MCLCDDLFLGWVVCSATLLMAETHGQTIMVQALDAAFQHYEADLQKRSAKSRDKPNGYVQE